MTAGIQDFALTKDFSTDSGATGRVNIADLQTQMQRVQDWINLELKAKLLNINFRSDNTLGDQLLLTRMLSAELLALIGSKAGWQPKANARVASPVDVTIAAPGATLDGVAMALNDRFLAPTQATAAQCGIYVWNGAAVPATRATDADTSAELGYAFISATEGSVNKGTTWVLTQSASDIVTLGTTALTWINLFKTSTGSVDSIAALKALAKPTSATTAFFKTLGYYAVGDGAAASYYWDAASVLADNGGSIIQSNAGGTGRWILFYEGDINVRWFGAKGDGATDDTAKFTAALAFTPHVYVPKGRYRVTGLSIGDGVNIRGDGKLNSVVVCPSAVSEALIINGVRTSFTGIGFEGTGTELAIKTGASGAYYFSFIDCRFFSLGKAFNVLHACYWSTFVSCDFRECVKGFESLTAQLSNAVSFVSCQFFRTTPGATDYPINVISSDGISVSECNFQNIGPRFQSCNGVTLNGGYWEAYNDANGKFVLYLVLSKVSCTGVFFPGGAVCSIDSDSIEASTGTLPPTTQYYENSLITHQYDNLFPDPACLTGVATVQWGSTPTGVPFIATITSGLLRLTSTNVLARATFAIPLGQAGVGAYVKIRCPTGTAKVQIYKAGGSFSAYTVIEDASNWSKVRLAVACDPNAQHYLMVSALSLNAGNIVIEIDEICIAPGLVTIGKVNLGQVTQIMDNRSGAIVNVPSAGSAAVITFSANDQGVWLVTTQRQDGNRSNAVQKSTGYAIVHSNSTITWVSISDQVGTTTVSALSLLFNNSGGSAVDMVCQAIKLNGWRY